MPVEKDHVKIIALNRKARYDYFIEEEFDAGMVLLGTEIKSIRQGRVNLKDSYAKIKNGEVFVHQLHISPYSQTFYDNHDPLRVRKLLLHKHEIRKLYGKINERGHALIPLQIYMRNGKAKITLALAKGKRKYDKRDAIRKRDEQREAARER